MLGAFKKGHRRPAREFIDDEFAYKLLKQMEQGCSSAKESLEWLAQFNNEYHRNWFRKEALIPFHADESLKDECSKREYAVKNDVYFCAELVRKFR